MMSGRGDLPALFVWGSMESYRILQGDCRDVMTTLDFVGIEREDEYVKIAKARCSAASLECFGKPDQRDSGIHGVDGITTDTVSGNGNTGKPAAKSDHKPRVHRRKSDSGLHNKTYVQLELF